MKKMILFIIIFYSVQSFAFLDFLFKKDVPNPMELQTHEERLNWLLTYDQDFKSYYDEMKKEQEKKDAENQKILDDLEKERIEAQNYSPEEIYKKKLAERQKKQQELNDRQRKIEADVLKKWVYIKDQFVNIDDEKRKKEQEKKDAIETERIRQFQMEEGLQLAPKGKKFHFVD